LLGTPQRVLVKKGWRLNFKSKIKIFRGIAPWLGLAGAALIAFAVMEGVVNCVGRCIREED
jgi:hypothetical protein